MGQRLLFLMTLASIVGTATLIGARPQDGAPDNSPLPVFHSQSDLVVLHVNVFDGKSDAVPDLPQDAFLVVEDNTPQNITFFSGADVPVAVGLIVDNSGSMIARRNTVLAGGRTFVGSSHPEDELFTVIFNEHIRYGLPDAMKFTTNQAHLQAALNRYPAGGKTAFYDAVIAGLDHLDEATLQKHVLVVLSDGEDNASSHSEKDMLDRARRSDAIIYTVSSKDTGTGQPGDDGALKRLAEATGGLAYFPKSENGVVEAFNEIAANIRRGYSIGYVPTNTVRDGSFRNVKVMVRRKGVNHLSVRSRHGYTASREDGSR